MASSDLLEEVLTTMSDLDARTKRMESRLVQLMLHVGVKPHGVKNPETLVEGENHESKKNLNS